MAAWVQFVPWDKIIQNAPLLIDAAARLRHSTQKVPPGADAASPESPIEALVARVESLEARDRAAAELDQQEAEHIAQLAVAVTALHRRLSMVVAGVALSFAVALAALLLAVF